MLMISDYSLFQQRSRQRFEGSGVHVDIIGKSSFSAPICALVAQGVGISILDALTAGACEGNGVVVRPFSPRVPYELWIVYPANHPRTDRVKAFAEILREHLHTLRDQHLRECPVLYPRVSPPSARPSSAPRHPPKAPHALNEETTNVIGFIEDISELKRRW